MRYTFNFDKWVINHFGMISTATISKEERDFFMKSVLKHNGEVFAPNEGSRFVGEIVVNLGSLDRPSNMLTNIEPDDCDLILEPKEEKEDSLIGNYNPLISGILPAVDKTKASVPSYEVDKVYPNEKKGITCVIFKNGDKRILKVSKKEPYCVETAVAYAIAEQVYGSNSAFTKEVRKALPVVEGDEKKFSYDLWKKENKNQEDVIVAKYDGMALSRIKETAESFSAYPNGMFVVDGEFCIDKKKEMK